MFVEDWTVSRSTLDRVWEEHFPDVKIPASNRFSKREHCERLKKMINTGDIVAGHNLSPEELEKYKNDKVNILSCLF